MDRFICLRGMYIQQFFCWYNDNLIDLCPSTNADADSLLLVLLLFKIYVLLLWKQ